MRHTPHRFDGAKAVASAICGRWFDVTYARLRCPCPWRVLASPSFSSSSVGSFVCERTRACAPFSRSLCVDVRTGPRLLLVSVRLSLCVSPPSPFWKRLHCTSPSSSALAYAFCYGIDFSVCLLLILSFVVCPRRRLLGASSGSHRCRRVARRPVWWTVSRRIFVLLRWRRRNGEGRLPFIHFGQLISVLVVFLSFPLCSSNHRRIGPCALVLASCGGAALVSPEREPPPPTR